MQFSVQNLFGHDDRYLICKAFSYYAMTLYEKSGSNTCMTFSTHKQKIPSKKPLFWWYPA